MNRTQFEQALLSPDAADQLRGAFERGELEELLPGIYDEMNFPQRTRYHYLTNFEHSLATMAAMPAVLEERLAGLLHDIGKRRTTTIKPSNGDEQYLGHAPAGARMSRQLLSAAGYPADLVERVCRWIEHHMDLHSAAKNGQSAKAQAKLLGKIEPDLDVLQRLQLADTGAMNPVIKDEKLAEARTYHELLRQTIRARGTAGRT